MSNLSNLSNPSNLPDQTPQTTPTRPGGSALGRAWVAVALIPVGLFLCLLVAQVIYTWLGYKPENDDAPLWADLVATIPGLAIFLVPCVAAVSYGWRGNASGDRRCLVPLIIAAVAGLWLVILSVVTLVASSL